MNELYFLGMDIVEEVKNILNVSEILCTNGMTDVELGAYKMGIANALSALESVIEEDGMPVINMKGMEVPTELSIDDLETYCEDL